MPVEVGEQKEKVVMEKVIPVPEIGKAGDAVVFGNPGHILMRPGKRFYTLICSDGKNQIRVKIPVGQAEALLYALEVTLYPWMHHAHEK